MKIASKSTIQAAENHLKNYDQKISVLIDIYGPCSIRPHKNYYQELVRSIISQQLSVKAAASILKKFIDLFNGGFPSPETILTTDIDKMRTAGLSKGKALYIKDLASHIENKSLDLDNLNKLSNEEAIAKLTAVKGIGEWTAHMFLMFAMGRLDILPHGDLGIKNAIKNTYGFSSLPLPEDVKQTAASNNWSPYESIASWYLWRSLENKD